MSLVILDRDGVINQIVVDPEMGTVNSPMHPSQVKLIEGAGRAIADLNRMGFTVRLATNQPAAAKGLTTRKNLEDVHSRVLELLAGQDARVASSHICWHQASDNCDCRKPKTGLLKAALAEQFTKDAWMVGDGVGDIQAGKSLNLRTAFLGPRKCDACKVFEDSGPDHWFANLNEFVKFLAGEGK